MPDPLDLALARAGEELRGKRPRTAALHERARAVMPGGNTRSVLRLIALSLVIGEADCERLVAAVRHFLETRGELLRSLAA